MCDKKGGSWVAAWLSFSVVLIGGCGDSGALERRYPVSGTVTYKGTPLEKGHIGFRPLDAANGRAAAGTIVNGKYQLTTAVDHDGALPGKYAVAIRSVETGDTELPKTAANGAGQPDQSAQANARPSTPAKYRVAETSGLTAEVKAQPNTFDFDLKDQ